MSVPALVAGYVLVSAHSERAVNTDPPAGDPGSTSGQPHHHRYWWRGN